MNKTALDVRSEEIQKTIQSLRLRILDRFPESSLAGVCQSLLDLSMETGRIVRWISKPIVGLRILVGAAILLFAAVLVLSVRQIRLETEELTAAEFVQMTEAGMSELVYIGVGVIFLVTLETRRKRGRVIQSINRLRSIAHIIDAHQLTKDPSGVNKLHLPTPHSPKREMSGYELSRYLDYCSEMLSLTSKVGFLYVQHFDDAVANDAVNDLESLTNGISTKIWQKIMILRIGGN